MEPPADLADPANPADLSDPSEACAKQPGKWALVRTLNHALKSYAVLPVRPALGGGGAGCDAPAAGRPGAGRPGPLFPRLVRTEWWPRAPGCTRTGPSGGAYHP